ncbi:coatomer subunit beta'-like [Limulus polyphemus]|uniref:Coatomer subunit beta'-like n=1 Tax=Limulus polyphemus TaxID=6850 RepID=A0ABM1RWH9_LIMPO|nr:coatomer subunit beta'-like [Limulus polyphemus]
MVSRLGESAESSGKNNVAFLSHMLLGQKEKALEVLINTSRLPEAAFFARTYLPSQISRVVKLWKAGVMKSNEKTAQALADPEEYENLFPGLQEAIKAEIYLKKESGNLSPAANYLTHPMTHERNVVSEMQEAEVAGKFEYSVADTLKEVKNPSPEQLSPRDRDENVEELNVGTVDISQIEEELELDINNLVLDENIDTSEINLDEDLLSED